MEIDILPPFNYHYKHRPPTVKSRGAFVIRKLSELVAFRMGIVWLQPEDVPQDTDQGMSEM